MVHGRRVLGVCVAPSTPNKRSITAKGLDARLAQSGVFCTWPREGRSGLLISLTAGARGPDALYRERLESLWAFGARTLALGRVVRSIGPTSTLSGAAGR